MSYQLSDLRGLIRQRLGWAATDQFVPDAELNSYINDSLQELHSLLVSINAPGEWYTTGEGITTVPGTAAYTLTGRIGRLVSVRFAYGDRLFPMQRFKVSTEVLLFESRGWSPGIPRYAINKQASGVGFVDGACQITFNPPPAGIYTVLVTYAQAAPVLAADSDVSDIGSDEYIVLDVMIKCLTKEEADVRVQSAQKEAFIERLKAQSVPLDYGQAATVNDARAMDYTDSRGEETWFWR